MSLSQKSLKKIEEVPIKPKTIYKFPEGELVKVNKKELKCFTVDEWKTVTHIKIDYYWYSDSLDSIIRKMDLLELQVQKWKLKLELEQERTGIWQDSSKYYESLYVVEHDARLKGQKTSKLKSALLITGIIIETSFMFGFATWRLVEY